MSPPLIQGKAKKGKAKIALKSQTKSIQAGEATVLKLKPQGKKNKKSSPRL